MLVKLGHLRVVTHPTAKGKTANYVMLLVAGEEYLKQHCSSCSVRITEMNENYNRQHQDVRVENNIQYGDLPAFIDNEYLQKNTAVNLCTLANLASAPSVPQMVRVDVKDLSNRTVLHWMPPLAGKGSGYYVLLRETTSPVWQKKIFTNQLEMTLPYSKDNYFFAVQAVSEHGNESLAVVPKIKR